MEQEGLLTEVNGKGLSLINAEVVLTLDAFAVPLCCIRRCLTALHLTAQFETEYIICNEHRTLMRPLAFQYIVFTSKVQGNNDYITRHDGRPSATKVSREVLQQSRPSIWTCEFQSVSTKDVQGQLGLQGNDESCIE